ncbi:AAA family ATPase [Jiangella rhizosphaerae]|uniref:Uncharacterized protein n=1 Tax=Jiangella rhizosphaerae TaxID=2293569 RepID=A0A418KSA8_9ACTN|nr:AAA family ATPase [Jiangella rhizosphaerae]RIQ25257.1 hypothetical protein DY240_11225 [Jiangella rhizosphaerae]
MQIRDVFIRNFRGVASARLAQCGDLNVLIGKNNAGKSTILDAINGFFRMVATGSAVDLEGPLSKETNFRRSADDERLEVEIWFGLSPDEFSLIHELIVDEAPQMRNALEGLDTSHALAVTVAAAKGDPPYVYIKSIVLVRKDEDRSADQILLDVGGPAAAELHKKAREAQRFADQARDLEAIGSRLERSDFSMYREGRYSRELLTSIISRSSSSRPRVEVVEDVERILRESSDLAEAIQGIESLASIARKKQEDLETSELANSVDTFSGQSARLPNYALAILQFLGRTKYLHLRDRRSPVGREEAQQLLRLKVRRGGTETLKNIQDTVQSLMGVVIDAFESQPEGRGVRGLNTNAEMDVDEVLVEMNGAGIREALRLVLDNELKGPDVLLVEEPEIHLHPALEMSMLRYLRSASTRSQIFVTTHSTNFLDIYDMRNVYLVSRDNDVEARLIDFVEAEEAIPQQLGLRLSSLFMFDRLIFVEGASDEAVLREIAAKIGLNLGRAGVGFVHMGGARNFTHYATESTLAFLSRRRVQMTFLLDRDESTDEERRKLEGLLGDRARLHVLLRRELENYLSIPAAIARFIAGKKGRAAEGDSVTPEEVSAQLDQVAELLKTNTLERALLRKFCRPLYIDRDRITSASRSADLIELAQAEAARAAAELDERIVELSGDAEAETAKFEERWAREKLALVPGHELIDGVCQQYGIRFKKERDAQRLAGQLDQSEIPEELARLLREVTR